VITAWQGQAQLEDLKRIFSPKSMVRAWACTPAFSVSSLR
jgi:hypothetical protein